jgi:demethylmenaquinone methyltransferase/2-methoxy-6-polyprenyl-1,4-benzoquinol methylase
MLTLLQDAFRIVTSFTSGLGASGYRTMEQVTGAEKSKTVSRMFGRIAKRYDLGNRVISLGRDQSWRRKAVKKLSPTATDDLLDIGAGTGDLTLLMAKKAQTVTALDFSHPMVVIGQRKAAHAGLSSKVAFVTGDALHLPFPDQSFDGIATAFTVRNLAKMEQGFAEMHRVLKPGGRLVCLEFTNPRSRIIRFFYRPYLHHILPVLGGILTGDGAAYRYLARSITAFPSAESLAASMRTSGFPRVEWQTLNMGTVAIHAARTEGAPATQRAAA